MLGASNTHVDTVLILDEAAWTGSHHRYKDQIELSALGAIYREHLVLYAFISETLRNGVLLSVVGSDHVDAALCELHDRHVFVCLVALEGGRELL